MITSRPLTQQEALTMCSQFRHLIGESFDPQSPGKGKIIALVPAPYDEARQWQFAQFFRECSDPVRCLQFYRGTEFAPLLLSIPAIRKRSIMFQDLRLYLHQNNIPFIDSDSYTKRQREHEFAMMLSASGKHL